LAAWLVMLALVSCAASAHAAKGPATSTITLEWTSPGDDGSVGTAFRYELRYSLSPISPANFFGATLATDVPRPSKPGHKERVKVRGLEPAERYYFALRTIDDHDNWSGLSNVVVETTPDPQVDTSRFPLAMSAPFPNPARSGASLVLSLPEASDVLIEVLDVSGRRVKTLVNGPIPAGESPVRWDLRDRWGVRLPYGSYWVLGHVGERQLAQPLLITP
jgi:hypothetical protein